MNMEVTAPLVVSDIVVEEREKRKMAQCQVRSTPNWDSRSVIGAFIESMQGTRIQPQTQHLRRNPH